MIQKSLRGTVEPQEQQEIDWIGRQRNVKNKGEAIRMPPLHEALVEVHKEYAKASRTAKGMADLYKKATSASDILNAQCTTTQAKNQQLSEELQQTQEKLKKTMDELLQQASTRRPLESDQELQQKLQQAEVALKEIEAKAETFEN